MHKCMCECVNVHVWIYFFLKVSSDKTVIALIPPLVSKWHGFNPSRSISEPLGKKAGEGCCLLIQKQDLQSAGLSIFTKPTGDASPQTEMWTTALEAWSQLSDLQGTAQRTLQDFALLLKVSFLRQTLRHPLPQACHSLPCFRIPQCLTSTADTEHSPGSSRAMRHSDWLLKHTLRDLPGGPVVNNRLPMQADLGSTLGWGTKVSHATEHLSLHPITRESLCSQKDK